VVLWQAFRSQIVVEETTIMPVDQHDIVPIDTHAIEQLQQIAEMGYAIARMAEQQIELQRQQQALVGRMDTAAGIVT
ncbi:MAG: hypothetical protein AVDCRST_MAG93-4727, partial [uncultured Chloroflexia bacterium]